MEMFAISGKTKPSAENTRELNFVVVMFMVVETAVVA
jgi:hypothetical protein